MTKRYRAPEGQKNLPDRILERLERGPATMVELYNEFPEYKTTSFPGALKTLRDRGHTIASEIVGTNRRGWAVVRYSKFSPKK